MIRIVYSNGKTGYFTVWSRFGVNRSRVRKLDWKLIQEMVELTGRRISEENESKNNEVCRDTVLVVYNVGNIIQCLEPLLLPDEKVH